MRSELGCGQDPLYITQRTIFGGHNIYGTRKAQSAHERHLGVNALKLEIDCCGINTALIPRRLRVLSFINGIGGGIND
jgi:hypothetical protein